MVNIIVMRPSIPVVDILIMHGTGESTLPHIVTAIKTCGGTRGAGNDPGEERHKNKQC